MLDRNCFAAMVYMAQTSTPLAAVASWWAWLRLGGDGPPPPGRMEQRRRVERLHDQLLDRLGAQGLVGWSRASLDTMSVRAKRGGTTLAQIRSIVASLGLSCT